MRNLAVLKLIVLTTVLSTTMAMAAPADAQGAPDFGSATPVPDHSGFEITDDGFVIYQGDMVVARCGSLRREDYTASAFYEEVVGICLGSEVPSDGARDPGTAAQPRLPETGGSPLARMLAWMLFGSISPG